MNESNILRIDLSNNGILKIFLTINLPVKNSKEIEMHVLIAAPKIPYLGINK